METYFERLPDFVNAIKEIRETIITNIVLLGQIPSPTFREKRRSTAFLERLAEFQVDECTTDGYRNPIGIVRGSSKTKPPIFVAAHLDTIFDAEVDHNFTISENMITGAAVLDNSLGIGVLVSLPEIFRRLNLKFESDIVLAGVIQSIGKGNLRGIRHLLKTWATPIRGAVCVEGFDLGRLSYYSEGMIRCEVHCNVSESRIWEQRFKPNAILVLHEVINQLLEMRLPQKPRSRIIIGKISGGLKHGVIAYDASLGFEIQSVSDDMVKSIFNDVQNMVEGIGHEYKVDMELNIVSNVSAAKLGYNHPLVKSAGSILKTLDVKPFSVSSESELSIFLSHHIPAVTVGISHGDNYHQLDSTMEIEPMYKGIAQLLGLIQAIDSGVCDGYQLA